MSKLLWFLSVITLPLLMIGNYRIASIPLTHLFIFCLGLLNFKKLLGSKGGRIEKSIYIIFSVFIVIAFLDLTRIKTFDNDFFFEIKLIVLLMSIKLYSNFILQYGIDFFLRWLVYSSGIVLSALLLRSLFVYNAPFFVVDAEQVTESGKNQLAFYLALIIPLIFWFFKNFKSSFIGKVIIALSLIIHLFAAIYVQSKGLILSLIVSYGISILFYSEIKIKLNDIVKFGFLLLIPVYFLTSYEFIKLDDFQEDIENLLNADIERNNSSNERMELAASSFNYFLDNPLFGIGTNNFALIEEKATHNNYLQILSENGIVGFVIVLIFFFNTHTRLIQMKSSNNSYLMIINSFWALTIYLFVINGFFNAITVVILALIIYYEKTLVYQPESILNE